MCGIVAATARRDVAEILMEGLRTLEYRGYDSAGILCVDGPRVNLLKTAGRVQALRDQINYDTFRGTYGIAHTRWATHGAPSAANAHPHVFEGLALAHNGIIENAQELRAELLGRGHDFASETDSEVLLHLIAELHAGGSALLEALTAALRRVRGSYAIALIDTADEGQHLLVARCGAPLVIGLGIGENFAASDVLALLPVTTRFIHLEDHEVARIGRGSVEIFDLQLHPVIRPPTVSDLNPEQITLGRYTHFMEKEIFEQDSAVEDTLLGRIAADGLPSGHCIAGWDAAFCTSIAHIGIVACGTSYHAGLVGKYYLEEYAGLSTSVEIASEFRYRHAVLPEHTLLIAISQSGETADTLAALRVARERGLPTLCICNAGGSTMVREADYSFLTRAGLEIGVASTKAFTTQLVVLLLLSLLLGRGRGFLDAERCRQLCAELRTLPALIRSTLQLNSRIRSLAAEIAGQHDCLFLGRGSTYPIALEGALKLKEITYINAQGYAAGELKHGPIALVDEHLPIVIVAPDNHLAGKLASNIEEVRSRGGRLYILGPGHGQEQRHGGGPTLITLPEVPHALEPMIFNLPLQLLAYHTALHCGTDVDRPRNLAKSVTVE